MLWLIELSNLFRQDSHVYFLIIGYLALVCVKERKEMILIDNDLGFFYWLSYLSRKERLLKYISNIRIR